MNRHTFQPASHECRRQRIQNGSVLVGVLWCVALLAVIVVGLLHTSRLDLMVGKYHSDRIQAHYLALAGIEKAKALLYQDAQSRSRAGVHHGAGLYNAPDQFRDVEFGRGRFRVMRPARADEGNGVIFGVSDEESRLNVNVAQITQLTNLVGLTSDIAAAIADWRDGDNAVSPGGAEAAYYESLRPPHRPRNAPFPTIRELLMVRGIDRMSLFGEPEPNDRRGSTTETQASTAASTSDPELAPEAGWAAWLTAHSAVQNVDASGADRINVQTADEAALTGVPGIRPNIAQAIIAYRNQNPIRSLVDLLNVTAAPPRPPPGNNNLPRNNNNSPPPNTANAPKVIDERLFKDIADHLTVESESAYSGLINVNSASVEVLMCLPGVDRRLAQAIVAQRKANGFFPNVAYLLDVPELSRDTLRQIAPLITMRSETFRILSEGRVGNRGSRERIEVVVHIGGNSVSTLAYREDDL